MASSQLHAVLGSDEGRVAEEAQRRYNQLRPSGSDDFGNEIIEGQADNVDHACAIVAQTLQALQTLPFFGGKMVWLKAANFLGDDRTGQSERTKESLEALLSTLKGGLDPNIVFLLSATSIDKRRSFYKHLKKEFELVVYDKIDVSREGWEEQVAQLVEQKATKMALRFAPDALELFVQQAGEDTRQILTELEKLALYCTGKAEVTIEDVRLLIPLNRKGVIWEISRAIERGEGKHAIELIGQQLQKGESAVGLLRAAMIPTVRNTFYAGLVLHEAGVRRADKRSFSGLLNRLNSQVKEVLLRKADGAVNTWALANVAAAASRLSLPQLRANLEACLKADQALVTTSAESEMVLTRLVIELTTP